MHRPGTTAVLEDQARFEVESEQARVTSRAVATQGNGAGLPAGPGGVAAAARQTAAPVPVPVTVAGTPAARMLPCTDDPDLFFAESPEDVECAKDLCRDCPARKACLAGAIERREPWGVWGGELFLRGEIVPRKRPRGRPRKDEVAA